MPRKSVESLVMNHYLLQLERSVCNLAGDPNFLA